MERMKKVSVVIADDHPIVRSAIKQTLAKESELELVGEASDGRALLDLCGSRKPDMAIIDLKMPGMNGFDTVSEIRRLFPSVRVVVFSGYLDKENQHRAIEAGAHASVCKTESTKDVIRILRSVMNGERYHSAVDNGVDPDVPFELCVNKELTSRERQILDSIAQGRTSRQIAEHYNISQWTVDKHRANIKAKLGLRNVAEMVRYAMENGGQQ